MFGWTISILQAVSSIALLATSAWLLSRADQRPSIMYLSVAVVGVRAFALGKAFFRYSERLVLHDATFRKATATRVALFSSMVKRAPVGLTETKLGSLVSTLVDDTEEALNLDLRFRPPLIQTIAVTIAGVVLYGWLAPQYLWVMASNLTVGVVITFLVSKSVSGKNQFELSAARNELSELVEKLVSRNRMLRAYGWQQESLDKALAIEKRVKVAEMRAANGVGKTQALIAFFTYFCVFSAILVSAALGKSLPGEQVAVLVLLPLAIFEYVALIPNAFQARAKGIASENRLRQLLTAGTPKELSFEGNVELVNFEKLSLSEVSVTYPNQRSVNLPDFEMKRGETIALVGESGTGKTTLANALVGFIRTSSGRLLVNGKSISDFTQDSLRRVIGLVEQDPKILAGNIRDNLLLASPLASDMELVTALKQVQLWSMLEAREGLETRIGANEKYLSGGELQRLALARNILAQSQLLILDEPTSSVSLTQGINLITELLSVSKKNDISVILITHDERLRELVDRLVKF